MCACRIALTLESDRIQVLYPDADTPFEDEFDVVNRLLPYHILQQPKEDLDAIIDPKGKSKAVEDIEGYTIATFYECIVLTMRDAETKFSIDCHARLSKLQDRFRRVRIASGKVCLYR